jgi:hypothetical protein
MDRRTFRVEEHLDHSLRDGIRAAPDSLDLLVAQVDGLIAEQLAAPIDRHLVGGWEDFIHRNALHKRSRVVLGVRA